MQRPPLILTLSIEKDASLYFNSLRKSYFPADRNHIDAHLTLFHALPNQDTVISSVKDVCARQKQFILSVKEPVSIGKGVAIKIESNELLQLHKVFQNQWQEFLSPQDKHKLWPHITVQNKVPATEAKKLLKELQTTFVPFVASAQGLQLWEYLGGPWKFVEEFSFQNIDF